jgi:sigma-54 dependent transcriptional regulator, acetoin dehydrogenase operon transcriptional activator AcoR
VLRIHVESYKKSIEQYLDCEVRYWLKENVPGDLKKYVKNPHSIGINKTTGKSEIFVPVIEKKQTWVFSYRFKPDQKISTQLLSHLENSSRAFVALLSNESYQQTELYYRKTAELLAQELEKSVILLDNQGGLIFENDLSKDNDLLHRFNNYVAQTGDSKIDNSLEYSFIIDDSNPILIYLTNIHFSNSYIGKLIKGELLSSLATKKKSIPFSLSNISFNGIIGKHPELIQNINIAKKVAITDSTVLLRGESGTGKELFAYAIHEISHRRRGPFVAINCAAIPENLLESELFGYEPGAFTGASKKGKIGKIEAAHMGTILLDEIGDMSPSLQAKLLRLLQNMQFERVGGTKSITVDVRFISATHRDLEDLIRQGLFRRDLFYRINVIPIYIPPLRERGDDIELLLNHFIKKYAVLSKTGYKTFSYDALQCIKSALWTGNIRELENVVEYCMTVSSSEKIILEDLPLNILKPVKIESSSYEHTDTQRPNRKISKAELAQLLIKFGYTTEAKKELAKHVGISLATLYRWLKNYQL